MIKFKSILIIGLLLSGPLWSMERHRYVQFNVGTGSLTNNLDGSGFQSKLNSKSLFNTQLQLGYQDITANISYHVNIEATTAQFNSPSGLSPQSVDIQNTVYQGYFLYPFSPSNLDNNLYWGLGYQLQNQSATQTSPNNSVSETEKHGLLFTGKHFFVLNSNWDVTHQLNLFLPILFKERSTKTGTYESAYGLSLQSHIGYMISDSSQFFTGLKLNYNLTTYSGTGLRGTTDAKESQLGIIVPIGIKWGF